MIDEVGVGTNYPHAIHTNDTRCGLSSETIKTQHCQGFWDAHLVDEEIRHVAPNFICLLSAMQAIDRWHQHSLEEDLQ